MGTIHGVLRAIVVWILTLGTHSLAVNIDSSDPSLVGVVCGPNAALVFLVLCGADVKNESIDEIPIGIEGASMLQLRDFCDKHGVPSEVRNFCSSDVWTMPLPAIWQSNHGGQDHYFVVFKIDDTGVFALDGTTGAEMQFSHHKVDRFFTGYALIAKRTILGRANDLILTFEAVRWEVLWINVGLLCLLMGGSLRTFKRLIVKRLCRCANKIHVAATS